MKKIKTKKNIKYKKRTITNKKQKGGANEVIGLDYDGVLDLNVKPLFNSVNSRLVLDKKPNAKYYDEFIAKLTAFTYPKFIITKNKTLNFVNLDAKIKALLQKSDDLIINADKTKIANLKNNNINYYFDDSNKHIFDV